MKDLSRNKKIVLVLLAIILIICAATFFALCYIFDGLKLSRLDKSAQTLGISESARHSDRNVKNIALFGLDGRNGANEGRSDSILILSIDSDNNVLKLTSILRDSYVSIDGHGHEKICHAYAYGGPELAIKTLNQNFNLDIEDYITANFESFSNVVNAVGGIDLEITREEMEQINNSSSGRLSNYGYVHLNGEQALNYSRIRKIDSDTNRANRQRKVLEAIFIKAKQNGMFENISLMKSTMPMLETSIGQIDLLWYAQKFVNINSSMIEKSIPGEEENAVGGIYEGAWVWRYDIDAAAKRLEEFIYG